MRGVAGSDMLRAFGLCSPAWLLISTALVVADQGQTPQLSAPPEAPGGVAGVPNECNSNESSPPNDCCESPEVVELLPLETVVVPFDTSNALTDGPEDKLNPCQSGANDAWP